MERCSWIYTRIALLSLMMGFLVYLFARPGALFPEISYSFDAWWTTAEWLVLVTGSLPDFLHTYAFILLTYVVLGVGSKRHLYISTIRFIDMAVFPAVKIGGVGDLVRNYFIHGTFDMKDLLAILLACLAAVYTILTIKPEEK